MAKHHVTWYGTESLFTVGIRKETEVLTAVWWLNLNLHEQRWQISNWILPTEGSYAYS